ncbi:MAG: hypothetical protein ACR2RB_06635, partial [Gammaproteobacteria bacterium]
MNAELKQGIKACRSFTDLRRLLAEVDSRSLGPRDIDLIYRTLRKCEEDADLKLAYLGNHTLDPFARYVAAAALSEGIMVDEYIGAFGQHYQEVADPASALVAFAPDVIFLTLSMKGLSPQIRSQFMSLSRSDRQLELQRILDHMRDWVDATKQRLQGTIVITNWPQPASPQAGIADAQLDFGECEFYLELNLQFLRAFKDDPRVYVFDLDRALARCGTHDA